MAPSKMLGLAAAMAALLAVVIIGSGSAAADVLCEENVGQFGECEAAATLVAEDLILAETSAAFPAVFKTPGGVEVMACDSSLLGKVGENDGAFTSILGLFTELTFTNCEGLCTAGEGHSAPFKFRGVASENHIFVSKDNKTGLLPGALFEECTFNAECLYQIESEEMILFVNADLIKAIETPLKESTGSKLCLGKLLFSATYLLTLDVNGEPGEPVYLTAQP